MKKISIMCHIRAKVHILYGDTLFMYHMFMSLVHTDGSNFKWMNLENKFWIGWKGSIYKLKYCHLVLIS